MRTQLRWWRPGGFRLPWLARATNGRIGLGRWTQAEVDHISATAARDAAAFEFLAPTHPADADVVETAADERKSDG